MRRSSRVVCREHNPCNINIDKTPNVLMTAFSYAISAATAFATIVAKGRLRRLCQFLPG